VMYALGNEVIQDDVYAHMWGNIAASKGNENGGELRDIVAKQMTPSQLEKAQDPVNGSVCADVFKNGNFWNANVVGVQALVGR